MKVNLVFSVLLLLITHALQAQEAVIEYDKDGNIVAYHAGSNGPATVDYEEQYGIKVLKSGNRVGNILVHELSEGVLDDKIIKKGYKNLRIDLSYDSLSYVICNDFGTESVNKILIPTEYLTTGEIMELSSNSNEGDIIANITQQQHNKKKYFTIKLKQKISGFQVLTLTSNLGKIEKPQGGYIYYK